jgi:hypothetical protein
MRSRTDGIGRLTGCECSIALFPILFGLAELLRPRVVVLDVWQAIDTAGLEENGLQIQVALWRRRLHALSHLARLRICQELRCRVLGATDDITIIWRVLHVDDRAACTPQARSDWQAS